MLSSGSASLGGEVGERDLTTTDLEGDEAEKRVWMVATESGEAMPITVQGVPRIESGVKPGQKVLPSWRGAPSWTKARAPSAYGSVD